jgi:hypothetical protein
MRFATSAPQTDPAAPPTKAPASPNTTRTTERVTGDIVVSQPFLRLSYARAREIPCELAK